jgi:hypothetical protein
MKTDFRSEQQPPLNRRRRHDFEFKKKERNGI